MGPRVVGIGIGAHVRRRRRDADDVLDACFQCGYVEGRLFGELGRLIVGCDEGPHDIVLPKPVRRDADPAVLDNFDARQSSEFLCCSAACGSCHGQNLVVREGRAGLDEFRQGSNNGFTCVARGTNYEESGSHRVMGSIGVFSESIPDVMLSERKLVWNMGGSETLQL